MTKGVILKDIALDPKTFLNEAFGIYKSLTYKKFLFVEGFYDKKFLNKKGFNENEYYYLGMCGKPMVITSLYNFKKPPFNEIKKIAFLIDNDYDHVTETIIDSSNLFINSICNSTKNHFSNDLESYLVCSAALTDWLDEFGLTLAQINLLKDDVERESRRIGKYRAANELLKKLKSLPEKATILFKIDIEEFFDLKNFLFLEKNFESRVRYCSNYKELVDELFVLSNTIDHRFSKKWQLSRGHDITELISIYLDTKYSISLSADEIEQYLRLSVDTSELKTNPTYRDLQHFFNY